MVELVRLLSVVGAWAGVGHPAEHRRWKTVVDDCRRPGGALPLEKAAKEVVGVQGSAMNSSFCPKVKVSTPRPLFVGPFLLILVSFSREPRPSATRHRGGARHCRKAI